jgi:hypothetical protein
LAVSFAPPARPPAPAAGHQTIARTILVAPAEAGRLHDFRTFEGQPCKSFRSPRLLLMAKKPRRRRPGARRDADTGGHSL